MKREGQQMPEICTLCMKQRVSKVWRQAELMFGVVVTKWRDRKWRGGLYKMQGAADARNTHAMCETAGVEGPAAGGIGVWGSYKTEGDRKWREGLYETWGGSRHPKYTHHL